MREVIKRLASEPYVIIPWWEYKDIEDEGNVEEEAEDNFFNVLKSYGLTVTERYDDHIKVERSLK